MRPAGHCSTPARSFTLTADSTYNWESEQWSVPLGFFVGKLSSLGKQLVQFSGGSPAEGSAGYVAIERVSGALQSRSGGFLLQHSGTMTPTSHKSTITVVPGSGTGELEGIAGSMSIEIENGKHFYDFDYTLPSSP